MALKIVRGKTLPIGVDLGSSSVKLAQLRLVEGEVELVAAGLAEMAPASRESFSRRLACQCHAIREVLKSSPFRGRHAVLAIPAEDSFVRHVRIPKVPPQETDRAVAFELQGKLPYPVDSAVIRSVVVGDAHGEGEPKQEVIVVAVSRRTLEGYLGMARRAKLDVVGVNVEPCAIVECFARLFRRASDVTRAILYLDLGAFSTQVVLSHGPRIVFARNLATGGRPFDQAIADSLELTLDQARAIRQDLLDGDMTGEQEQNLYRLLDGPTNALADEINKCLRYYESIFKNAGVERVIFLGGQAGDKRLCQALAQRLNLPAQVGDPLVRVRRGPGLEGPVAINQREPQPRWTVAVGLSLGADRAA